MNSKLVSFVITSYNNYKYIREAANSVLIQDYPRIQLIFSDDGSDDFCAEELRTYIDMHKDGNIVDVQIYAHETNRGTVCNVEFCRQKASGDYIMYMAADDALNGADVLSRYVAEFERLGSEALVLCAKVAMCGQTLEDIQGYEPSPEGIRIIKDFSPQQLFGRMCHTWIIPTTTCCYRREVYEVVGGYDTDYFIMEDGPLFMKLARNGHRIHWVSNFVAARHRNGGISHGNTLNLSEAYQKYRHDEITFFEKEVLPFQERLSPVDKNAMETKWAYLQRAYFDTFILPNMRGLELLKYNISNFPQFTVGILRRTKEKAVGWIEDRFLERIMLSVALQCILTYALLLVLPVENHVLLKFLLPLNLYTALIFSGFSVFFRAMRIVRQLYLTIKYIFTGRG